MTDDLKTGRFSRLAKLASLSARLSGDVVSRGMKRIAGGDEESLLGHGAAEKLVATLGDLKGLAMKMGQVISMDPDLLSPEVRAVVARLQNQAPPMSWPRVREVVTAELGRPPEEAFRSFEPEPLASASLGQVHRAVAPDGTKVAVKVQYPDIARALFADLENLSAMVSVVASSTRLTHGKAYFAELRDSLMDELDYREEARRARRFAAAAAVPDLVVPRVFEALTSERVLTLELLEGQTLKDFFAHGEPKSNEERFRVARLLVRALWAPFLLEGVVHADPHPGNFMLLRDGRLGVLDFGSVKQSSPAWLDVNRRMYRAIVRHEPFDVVGLSLQSGFELDDHAAAREFIHALLDVACRASVTRGEFDYAAAGINRDLKAFFVKNALKLKGVRPPKEGVMFFRAVGGLNQNLENLGARGDYNRVYDEMIRLIPNEGLPPR